MLRYTFFNILPILTATWLLTACAQPTDAGDNSAPGLRPVINSFTADPSGIQPGGFTTLTVEAQDPRNRALEYTWRATSGEFIGTGPEVLYTGYYCCVGENRVTVQVSNDAGASVEGSIGVTITSGNP